MQFGCHALPAPEGAGPKHGTPTHYNPAVRADRLLMLVGPLVVVVLIVWLAGFSGPDRPHAFAEALWVLFTSAPLALCWLVAAFGYGWPLRRWLLDEGPDWAAIDMGLGVAFMLIVDAGLGALGILQQSGGFGAWVVVLIGFGLVIAQLRRVLRPSAMVPWPAWAAAPAIAVLLLAVCSAPGWLWATEFGGYDALSYHLQLPKEWLALDRIAPLDHNVYSYLPGYVEAAYYHLAVLNGDAIASVYACQLLHAGFTLLTAALVGRIAWRLGGRMVGAAAAAIVLGTPWTVVAGSLGYNDMVVAFLLATGLLVIQIAPPDSLRRGAALGMLAAAACGAKLTAIGFVAVPLGLLMLAAVPPKRWLAPAVGAVIAAVICLLPYLVRNWVYSGNPVFPFATGLLGLGHWTQQQAEIWTSGHLPDLGLAGRLGEAWNQLARFGIGPNPDPAVPWRPQWSLLPWLAAGGLAAGLATPALRSRSWRLAMVLAVQLVFWLALTHIKSRFMLPAVVPAALALAIGLEAIAARARPPVFAGVLAAVTLAWCCLPVVILLGERNRMPAAMVGWGDVLTGNGLTDSERPALADAFPVVYVNHILAPETRTLLVGEATPLYYRGHVAYQTTWDRGPLSEVLRHSDDPRQWMVGLREQGFTHLMVNPEMLELWENEGWNDPLLTAPRVIDAAEQYADLEREFPVGLRLYRLR
jgi:4-amino-4-deoxy-L-arabinose transferase-like glycosyltransferase